MEKQALFPADLLTNQLDIDGWAWATYRPKQPAWHATRLSINQLGTHGAITMSPSHLWLSKPHKVISHYPEAPNTSDCIWVWFLEVKHWHLAIRWYWGLLFGWFIEDPHITSITSHLCGPTVTSNFPDISFCHGRRASALQRHVLLLWRDQGNSGGVGERWWHDVTWRMQVVQNRSYLLCSGVWRARYGAMVVSCCIHISEMVSEPSSYKSLPTCHSLGTYGHRKSYQTSQWWPSQSCGFVWKWVYPLNSNLYNTTLRKLKIHNWMIGCSISTFSDKPTWHHVRGCRSSINHQIFSGKMIKRSSTG